MSKEKTPPPQHQAKQPGEQSQMNPPPAAEAHRYLPAGKLKGKVAIVTGGDSGIGRAVSVCFAKEGADVVVAYLQEEKDAQETRRLIEQEGRKCVLVAGDIGEDEFCDHLVRHTVAQLGRLDILVNNAAEQHVCENIEELTTDQIVRTFQTNIFSMFYLCRAAVKEMKEGSTIINTTSVTAYKGNPTLLDYSSTKGAIVAFTRSLSMQLAKRKIRVNAVAPGPIWTPLIPATFPEQRVETFGENVPMERPGQPDEVAPCFVFLACDESSYISGQTLHPNGGTVVNG